MGESGDEVEPAGLDGLFDAVGHPAPPRPGRFRSALKALIWLPLLAVVVACIALPAVLPPSYAAREAAYAWEDLPTDLPLDAPLPQRSVLTDKDGKPFAVVQGQDRTPVPLKQVSPYVVDALLATEDSRYYERGPLDLAALARAALRSGGGDVQGGSGLTQQYVKNLLLTEARTPEEEAAATEQVRAQAPRAEVRRRAREAPDEGRDPRALPQHRELRRRRVRRGRRPGTTSRSTSRA